MHISKQGLAQSQTKQSSDSWHLLNARLLSAHAPFYYASPILRPLNMENEVNIQVVVDAHIFFEVSLTCLRDNDHALRQYASDLTIDQLHMLLLSRHKGKQRC